MRNFLLRASSFSGVPPSILCYEYDPGVKHDTRSVPIPVRPSADVAAGVPVDVLAVPVAAAAIESPPGAVQTPDIESLRPRAEEYWRLLISGDRAGASQFLRPEDRPAFLLGQKEPLRDPAIESIELSDDGAQATVEIAIDVITPVGVFPWKIRQQWIGRRTANG